MKKIIVYPVRVSIWGANRPEHVFFSNAKAQFEYSRRDYTARLPREYFSREDAKQVPIFDTVEQADNARLEI